MHVRQKYQFAKKGIQFWIFAGFPMLSAVCCVSMEVNWESGSFRTNTGWTSSYKTKTFICQLYSNFECSFSLFKLQKLKLKMAILSFERLHEWIAYTFPENCNFTCIEGVKNSFWIFPPKHRYIYNCSIKLRLGIWLGNYCVLSKNVVKISEN